MTLRTRMASVLAVLVTLCFSTDALGDTPEELASRSSRAFQEAVETIDSDRAAAIEKLEESIALLERVIDEHGIENASIHYNIANAHALADRLGRAIEHYHLALRLDPKDPQIADNLAYVRGRVPDRLGPAQSDSTARRVLDAVDARIRLGLLVAVLGVFWGLLIVRSLVRERVRRSADLQQIDEGVVPAVPLLPAVFAAAVALILGGTLAAELVWPKPTIGVVVDAPTVARQGPSDAAYDAAFTRPVNPGIEFRVLEIRDGIDAPGQWVLAEFGDARRAWFRRGSVALIGE
jgi:hypothetical protein